jgi:hypothetical protein
MERAIRDQKDRVRPVLMLEHADHCLGSFCPKCLPPNLPQSRVASPATVALRHSAVISSEGKHKFKIDNDESPTTRREDLVHASVPEIHETLSRLSPDVKRNTQKVKRAAERLHQKKKFTARDLDRCEKEF